MQRPQMTALWKAFRYVERPVLATWSPSLAQWQRARGFEPGPAALGRFADPKPPLADVCNLVGPLFMGGAERTPSHHRGTAVGT